MFIVAGGFLGLMRPNMVSAPMSKERQRASKITGVILASIGLTVIILSESYFTPEHLMVKNEFTIAEVKSGVVEDISFEQDDGVVITVNGEPLSVETNRDDALSLIDVDAHPYAHVTPEIGATVEYKEYDYNDTDYASVIAYSQPSKD